MASPVEKDSQTMPTQKTFKHRVRTRMTKTGESYTAARAQLVRKASTPDPAEPAPPMPEIVAVAESDPPPTSDEAVVRASGKTYGQWFDLLDTWGGTGHTHTQIARWLVAQHGVDGWWSQSITVAYERARGMRARHQMPGGFEVAVTRTINVDPERLLEAFTNVEIRRRWLPEADLRQRPTRATGTARFDWSAPTSRIVVVVADKGSGKALVSVTHERLPDAEAAGREKTAWRERLGTLRSYLERR